LQVSATTNVVDIDVGQFADYKGNLFQDAVKQGKEFFELESSFAIDGVPTAYHIGVKMSVGGSDYVTIFVDPNIHVTVEKMELQPQNEVISPKKTQNTLILIIAAVLSLLEERGPY
jgi:hypothetical protein